MPDLMPEDQFKILVDGRLYLSTLGISLTSIPRQYCIEDVVNNGEIICRFFNIILHRTCQNRSHVSSAGLFFF